MSMTDPIADMLTRIRNAMMASHANVTMPASKLKEQLAKLLKEEGYISDYIVKAEGKFNVLEITLKYDAKNKPVITKLERISKPGLRVYAKASEIPSVLNGLGIAIVSTSEGLMTGRDAKAKSLGGEVLAYIW